MYVHKPPMYIRFDEIDNVHFARSDATTRSFDFEIVQRSGNTINFSNIAKYVLLIRLNYFITLYYWHLIIVEHF